MNSTLSIEPLRQKASSSILLARFNQVDSVTLKARPDFEKAMLLEVNDACEFVAFAYARTTDSLTARAQHVTLANLWFRVPKVDAEPATGQDGVGPYEAQLFRDGAHVQRKITQYTSTWQRGAPKPIIEDSFLSATLTPNGWFNALESTLVLGGGFALKTRIELALTATQYEERHLAGVSRNEGDYVWANMLTASEVVEVAAEAAQPTFTPSELRQHQALKEVTYAQARDLFAVRLATSQNVHEQWPLMARFLEAHPEAVPEYAKDLVTGAFAPSQLGTAFLALGKAKVPQARDALLQIRKDKTVVPMSRLRANIALADRVDVGLTFAQSLRADTALINSTNRHESFVARNSALALGMMVGARPRTNEVKQEARAAIAALLAQGHTRNELSPAFGAMGNAADPSYLADLAPFTHHPDPEVRAVAAKGFRRLHPEQTEAFVTEWLARETSPEVKREVFRVIYHQHLDAQQRVSPDIARLAVAHLRQQPYVLTRQSLVRILGPLAKENAEVKAALVAQVKLEAGTSSGLYSLISRYVDGEEVSASLHTRPELFDSAVTAPTPTSEPDLGLDIDSPETVTVTP